MVNDLINSDFERKPVNKNTLWQYVSLFNSRNSFYEPVLKKLEEDVAQNDLHPIKYRIHQLEDEFKRKEINERIQQLQSTNNHFDQTGLENIQNELNQLERQHQEMEQEHAQYLETASATQELLEEKEQEYKAFFIDYQSMVKEVLGMPDNEDPQVVSLVTGILATTGLVDNLFNKLADYFKPYGPIDEHLTTTYMVFGHEALWGNDDPSENYFLALHNRRVQFIKDEVEKSKHLPEGQISVYLDDMLINNKVANQYAKRLGLGIEHDLIRRFETLVQKSMLEFLTGSYWDVTKESVKSTVNKDRFHIRWNEQAQAEAGVSNLADESFSQGVIGSLDDEKTYWRNLHDSYQNFVNDFGVAIEQTLEKSLAVEELLHYYLQPVSASRDFIPFPIQDRMALEMTQEDYNRVIVGYMNYVIRPSDNLTGN